MIHKKLNREYFLSDFAILIYLAFINFIGHMLVSGNYGYFLDEFYTIACSKHLSFAFIDLPPVAPALLALNTAIFGISLPALHFIPALFSGLMVIIVGLMAKQIGGGKFAVILAGLAAMFVPVWMALGSLYTYDFLDQFFIILLFYIVLHLIKYENPKIWLIIGAVAGIGLMTKPSMVFFITALVLALFLIRHRKQLLTPWPWLGGLIALLIILPALIWQFQHGFPIAEYCQSYSKNKVLQTSHLEYLLMQVIAINFILFPIWLTGLYYFLFHSEGKKYRWLGLVFIILLLLLITIRANLPMLAPAYAMLFAGGSVAIERYLLKRKWQIIKYIYISLIILVSLIQTPNYMPILPVNQLISYYQTLGSITGIKSLKYANEQFVELPNFIYNRFEWDVLVRDVANVYYSLPKEEQLKTGILSQNYGWAGAVDLLGEKYHLPQATCGQLNYYLFSTDNLETSTTWIIIGESYEDLAQVFKEVNLAKIVKTKIRLPHETPIFICKEPKITPEQAKIGIKKFD